MTRTKELHRAAPTVSAESRAWRVDAAHRAGGQLTSFAVGPNRLAVAAGREADRQTIEGRLERLAAFDLAEPFERIREAVEEAHKANRA